MKKPTIWKTYEEEKINKWAHEMFQQLSDKTPVSDETINEVRTFIMSLREVEATFKEVRA